MKRFKSLMSSLLGSQITIVVFYILAMLVPNILLAITEPYRSTTIAASIMLPAAAYLLWSAMLKRPGIMILLSFPVMILCAFQLVLLYMFGQSIIAVDMFTNIFTTSVGEASEVLGNITVAIVGVCVLYIPLIMLAVHSLRIKHQLTFKNRITMGVMGTILLFSGGIMALTSSVLNKKYTTIQYTFPINVIRNIVISVDRWERLQLYDQSSRDFSFGAFRTDSVAGKEVYVLVVGEASRASSWGLYGHERNTTPRLDSTSYVVPFYDVLTQSNTTHKSVPILLTSVDAEHFDDLYSRKSVVTLFKEAGFNTLFVSNQERNRSFIDAFADEADSTVRMHEVAGMSLHHYDSDVIPVIAKAVAENTGKLFIVFHSYGSHFDFSKRYPPEFAHFKPDNIESVNADNRENLHNAYDNSILFTDYVLSEIIGLLKADTASHSALYYCADHGDDIMDDDRERFLHASPTTTYYQLHVASFCWFSDRYVADDREQHYLRALTNQYRSATTEGVFHTLTEIAHIGSSYFDPSRSMVNRNYVERERMYVDDYNYGVNVLNSGLTDDDLAQFDKWKLKYDIADRTQELY